MITHTRFAARWRIGMGCLLALVALPALSQVPVQGGPAVIVVSGSGEVVLAPDRASVVISVETAGSTAASTGADNAKIHKAVLAALSAAGAAADDMSGLGYTLTPTWRYTSGTPVRTGYRATNNVRLEVKQLDRVGALIDAALAAGATGVGDIGYDSKERDQARQQALVKAVNQARTDADTMAKAAGGRLGPLLELSTDATRDAPVYGLQEVVVSAAAKRADVPTTVDPQQIHITASVHARWQYSAGGN